MITDDELRALYNRGNEISHLVGLEMVWDAAQLAVLYPGRHHHRHHHHHVTIAVPDPEQQTVLTVEE